MLEIRGLVADVQAGSILKLDSLTIRDEEGRLWSFKVEGQLGFTPSHLREHQVLAQPVIVRYRETPDGLVALDLTD